MTLTTTDGSLADNPIWFSFIQISLQFVPEGPVTN